MRIRIAALIAVLLWAAPALATQTINIANAPGWQSGHSYALKDRVTAGAGWNGSAYTSGSKLCVFAVTVGGTSGSSASAFDTACDSGTAAGVGGGLLGTIPAGWSGKTTVTDGGATWVLLSLVDYVSITGYDCDTPTAWAQSTSYVSGIFVLNGGNCYYQFNASCTSAGTGPGPTGTTFLTLINDNDCLWQYEGPLTYSSQNNRLAHQVTVAGKVTMQFNEDVLVRLWYGGAQRQSYKPGINGELSPLQTHAHEDRNLDITLYCEGSTTVVSFFCNSGTNGPWLIIYEPPPGDAWQDNVTTADPLWYDLTKGVNIYNDAAWGVNAQGDGWSNSDTGVKFWKLQIVSEHSIALATTPGNYASGPHNGDMNWCSQCIIVGGDAASGAFNCDFECTVDNSLVVSRTTAAGSFVFAGKYQPILTNNTFACAAGVANSTGVQLYWWQDWGVTYPWTNNVIIGCTNPYAVGLEALNIVGSHNATDVATAPTNSFATTNSGYTFTADAFPGTTLAGITPSAQFVNPSLTSGQDWRIKNTSADIYGAGVNFSSSSISYAAPATADGPDIYGTTRSGRFDLGAAQFASGAPPAPVKGGKIRGGLWH